MGDNNKNGVFLSVDKKNQFLTRYGYYADQSVFDIFTFRFLEGDPQNALVEPYSIVLSKRLADKLFPEGKPSGNRYMVKTRLSSPLPAYMRIYRQNPPWHPAYLLPMKIFTALTGWKDYEDNYWAYSFYTYVLLKPNASPQSVDAKIHDALKDYRKEHYPYLRPMSKLFLNPYFQNDFILILSLYSFIALLILMLSSINYINLQTANATTRFREIGIKKTVGFTKKQLWKQFMFESIFFAIISALIGLVLCTTCHTCL